MSTIEITRTIGGEVETFEIRKLRSTPAPAYVLTRTTNSPSTILGRFLGVHHAEAFVDLVIEPELIRVQAMVESLKPRERRYVGGLVSEDGHVSWTKGVNASSPGEAKRKLAEWFNDRVIFNVTADSIGIVRVRDLDELAEAAR